MFKAPKIQSNLAHMKYIFRPQWNRAPVNMASPYFSLFGEPFGKGDTILKLFVVAAEETDDGRVSVDMGFIHKEELPKLDQQYQLSRRYCPDVATPAFELRQA